MPTLAPPNTGIVRRYRAAELGLADGAAVASWPPMVGTGTPTQSTAAARPAYTASAIGGKPAVRWPDTASNGDFLQASGMTTTGIPVTLVVVVKAAPGSVGGLYQAIHWGIELHTQGGFWRVYNGATLISSFAHTSDAAVITIVNNGANSQIYGNGTLVASGNIGTNNGTSNTLSVGWHPSQSARAWRGDIAELISYSGVLSASDRATAHSYAQDYYGISVADYIPTDTAATATLSGSGALGATPTPATSNTPQLSSAGTLTLNATVATATSAVFAGTGQLAPTPQPSVGRPVALGGGGQITVGGTPSQINQVQLSGTGALAALTAPATQTTTDLTGGGTLATTVNGGNNAYATLNGDGALTSSTTPATPSLISLAGLGTLAVLTATRINTTPQLSGGGSLNAEGTQTGGGGNLRDLTITVTATQHALRAQTAQATLTANTTQHALTAKASK